MVLTKIRCLIKSALAVLALAMVVTVPMAPTVAEAAVAKKAKPGASAQKKAKPRATVRAGRKASPRTAKRRVVYRPPSVGQLAGLHNTEDPLDLKSGVALVVDQDTDEVLFSKNPDAVLPIASITKLMTALVVVDAGLSMDEDLVVSQDDVRGTQGSNIRSKLRPGTRLSRGELMHLSLMSSENRAAHALGRTYPGGLSSFVRAMNRKAAELGMTDTRYVEPTGLSADNRSSAVDLARLVKAASEHAVIRDLSTSLGAVLPLGPKARPAQFHNTNGLVHNPEWEIGLQKTGFISAAGRSMVVQAELAGRQLIMVLLDSAGRFSRIGDAERLRKWLAEQPILPKFGRRAEPLPQPLPAQPALAAPAAAPVVPVLDPSKPVVHVPALPLLVVETPQPAAVQPR